MKRNRLIALAASILLSATLTIGAAQAASPQTTAFTYQGQLNAGGTLPTGLYQFTFTLFDAPSGGAVASGTLPIQQPIQVINGLFTTDLDFGQAFNGSQYWLEIKVGTLTSNEETLSARQPINAVPVAQYALNSPAGRAGLVFAANIYNPFTGSTFFFAPSSSGDPTGGGNWTAFNQTAIAMPAGCTFDRLYLNLSAVPAGLGGGGLIAVTLYVNGSGTPLVASADSTFGAVGDNVSGAVTVNLGDMIALQASGPGLTAGQGTISTSLHCL